MLAARDWRACIQDRLPAPAPNTLGPVIVCTRPPTIPSVMLLEAFLSFLGLGVHRAPLARGAAWRPTASRTLLLLPVATDLSGADDGVDAVLVELPRRRPARCAGSADEEELSVALLLSVRGLRTWFSEDDPSRKPSTMSASMSHAAETLGIVGESGSGKSVTNLSIMRLIPTPPGRIVSGEIQSRWRDPLTVPADEMRRIRGKRIAMIFQIR